MVHPNKENKILIGDSEKLIYFDLNESKEINTIFPSKNNTEYFQIEADPHHQNLVNLINLKILIIIRLQQ